MLVLFLTIFGSVFVVSPAVSGIFLLLVLLVVVLVVFPTKGLLLEVLAVFLSPAAVLVTAFCFSSICRFIRLDSLEKLLG